MGEGVQSAFFRFVADVVGVVADVVAVVVVVADDDDDVAAAVVHNPF